MPHSVGHPVGLGIYQLTKDVHDPIPQSYFGNTTSYNFDLAVGHVNTIEPGIYFIPFLLDKHRQNSSSKWNLLVNWTRVDEYMHVGGVRIEDVVIVFDLNNSRLTWIQYQKLLHALVNKFHTELYILHIMTY
jgi:Xaa-Pro aminopeptidase